MSESPLFAAARHRLLNDLNLIHALLGMAKRRTDDTRALRLFVGTQARIRAIALSHRLAWRSSVEQPEDFDARAYLESVARDTEQRIPNRSAVRTALEVDGVRLPIDKIVALGLLATELIGNAFEHAFPDGRAGTVRVALVSSEPGMLVLKVEDDGVGMNGAEQCEQKGELGLAVVRLLVEQLAGDLEFRTTKGQGSAVSVRFPLATEAD